jgi:hypothetical protein
LIPFVGHDSYEAWRCGAIRDALGARNLYLLPPPAPHVESRFGCPTLPSIRRVVCSHYRISQTELLSQRRTKDVVLPRQIAMYLARHLTIQSMPQIGRATGRKDHTTVLHAVRKIERLLASDIFVASVVLALEGKLAAQCGREGQDS